MKMLSLALLTMSTPGCIGKYEGWEHVRIEFEPVEDCSYVVQEVCAQPGVHCYNWFKKRAVVYDANTVVITRSEDEFTSKSSSLVLGNTASSSSSSSNLNAMIADYLFCK